MLPIGMRLVTAFRLPGMPEHRAHGGPGRPPGAPGTDPSAAPGLGIEFERYNPEDPAAPGVVHPPVRRLART
ncbi:MAG: hypothetical protein Q9Q13_01430 [Acidobacteriota bacterium]|nr:hypothetical protein [Acidobacteriota bacterium]